MYACNFLLCIGIIWYSRIPRPFQAICLARAATEPDIWMVFRLESVTLETKLKGEMVLNLFYTNLTISSVMILQVSDVRRSSSRWQVARVQQQVWGSKCQFRLMKTKLQAIHLSALYWITYAAVCFVLNSFNSWKMNKPNFSPLIILKPVFCTSPSVW